MQPAAVLRVLVQAEGVAKVQRQAQDLDRDLKKVGASADQQSGKLARIGAAARKGMVPAVAVLGAAGVAAKKTITAASDLSEQINKTGTVFGRSGKEIHSWSRTTASSIGISQRAALEAAGTFGNMLVPMGFARGKAADMSKSMVELSADMASFNNADPSEVLEALRSGLAGETEPLRKFGVFLNQARIEQIALNKGLWDGKGKIDDQTKAAATMALIMRDTRDAQGDFAKTSDSAANAARIQAARTEDLNAKLGRGLLPVYQSLQQILLKVTGFMANHSGIVKAATGVVVGLAVGVVAVNGAMKVWAASTAVATGAQAAFNAVLAANPIALVIAALVALGVGLVIAYKKSETFRRVVDGAFDAVEATARAVFGWLRNAVRDVVDFLKARWENIKTGVGAYWDLYRRLIINPIRAAFDWLREAVGNVAGWLGDRWNNIKDTASSAWQAIRDRIINPVRNAAEAVRNALGGDGLLGWLRERFDDFKNVAEKLTKPFVGAFDKIAGAVKGVVGWLDKVVGRVKSVIDFIGKIKLPKINLPFFGDDKGGSGGGPVGPGMSPPANVDGFNKIASMFGNVVTSGYRPGDDGWHGQNRARDYAGGNMLGFARFMAQNFGSKLLELIHTPLGFGIKNGSVVPLGFWGSAVNQDHYDHVHVAMEKGGHVRRGGWALVGEKGPELARLPGGTTVYPNGETRQMMGAGGGFEYHHHGDVIVTDRFDERRHAADIAWQVRTA